MSAGERYRDATGLSDGQFIWQPALAPDGPVYVVVTLGAKLIHVYRGKSLLGIARIEIDGRGPARGVVELGPAKGLQWSGRTLASFGDESSFRAGGITIPEPFAKLFSASVSSPVFAVVVEHRSVVSTLSSAAPWLPQPASGTTSCALLVSRADAQARLTVRGGAISSAPASFGDHRGPVGTHAYFLTSGGGADQAWIALSAASNRQRDMLTAAAAFEGLRLPAESISDLALMGPGSIVVLTDGALGDEDENTRDQSLVLGPHSGNVSDTTTTRLPRRSRRGSRLAVQSEQPLFPRLLERN